MVCHAYSEQVQNGMNEMSVLCLYGAKPTCSYAINTASVRVLIGPPVCYAEIHALAESVHQNYVLGRCTNLCSIIVLHIPSSLHLLY